MTRDPQALLRQERLRRWKRITLGALASAYLLTVWLDAVGSNGPAKFLPRPWLYFSQVAALFPSSSPVVIDYRAEGWSCADHAWREIDIRPFFPMNAENKENRFYRAIQFYPQDRTVLRALDAYVVEKVGGAIGGVRFSSLRIRYPKPGEHVEAYRRVAMAELPQEQRRVWYYSPRSMRAGSCGSRIDDFDDDTDSPKPTVSEEP